MSIQIKEIQESILLELERCHRLLLKTDNRSRRDLAVALAPYMSRCVEALESLASQGRLVVIPESPIEVCAEDVAKNIHTVIEQDGERPCVPSRDVESDKETGGQQPITIPVVILLRKDGKWRRIPVPSAESEIGEFIGTGSFTARRLSGNIFEET